MRRIHPPALKILLTIVLAAAAVAGMAAGEDVDPANVRSVQVDALFATQQDGHAGFGGYTAWGLGTLR